MAYFTVNGHSRKGPDREQNEDAFSIGEHAAFGKSNSHLDLSLENADPPTLVTLADGMGGHDRGELASQTVVQSLISLFNNDKWNFNIDLAISFAHQELIELGMQNRKMRALGTTVVGAILFEDRCDIFNVGDSRAYLLSGEILKQLSIDDTYPGKPNSSITQCIGGGQPSNPIAHKVQQELKSGDKLVFVSDGITDTVNNDILQNMLLESSNDPTRKICDKAASLGGEDDASIIICNLN